MRSPLLALLLLLVIPVSLKAQREFEKGDKPPIRERIYFGINPGFAISSSITQISLSPQIGYMIKPRWSAGVGMNYLYLKYRNIDESDRILGASVFTNWRFYRQFLLYGEYERTQWQPRDIFLNQQPEIFVNALYLGGGIYSAFSDKGGFMLLILYDFLYEEFRSVNADPLVIRGGIVFSPF